MARLSLLLKLMLMGEAMADWRSSSAAITRLGLDIISTPMLQRLRSPPLTPRTNLENGRNTSYHTEHADRAPRADGQLQSRLAWRPVGSAWYRPAPAYDPLTDRPGATGSIAVRGAPCAVEHAVRHVVLPA